MSLFGNLKSDDLEESQDRLGGYAPLPTDIYTGTIKAAYAAPASSGALGVTVILDLDGREYRETCYVTNKQGDNWYAAKDKDGKPTGKKAPLPGFTVIDEICLVTTDNPLADQQTEKKVFNVYDSEARREIPKNVDMLVDLLGKTVSVAIVEQLENKNVQENGKYVPTAETRTTNLIEKVFHTETQKTVPEILKEFEKPVFWEGWLERYKGKQRDKRTIKDGAGVQSGRPGSRPASSPPTPGQTAAAPRRSLFAKG